MNPFSKKATTYDTHSFIQKEVNNRLLNRLDLIKHDKSNILEIGSGTGKLSQDLEQKYWHRCLSDFGTSFRVILGLIV